MTSEKHGSACGRWLAWGAVTAYWLALFVATHVPARVLPQPGVSDKLVHLVAFGGLGLLLCLAWSRSGPWRSSRAWVVLAVLAAYAAVDEALQIPVGRNGDVLDWIADVLGAGLAVAVWSLWRRWRGAPPLPEEGRG